MNTLKYAAAISVILALNIIAGCNDKQAAIRDDLAEAEVLASLATVCGRGHAVNQDGRYLCVYVNSDGESVTRAIFDAPVKGVM